MGLGDDDSATVKYSLTIYTTTVIGYLTIILAAWPLGVVKLSLVSAVTVSLLRIFTGGAHASNQFNCVFFGTVIFPMMGLAAKHLEVSSAMITGTAALAVWLFVLGTIYWYAPADTPGKPISTMQQRGRLRLLSFLVALCWAVWALAGLYGVLDLSYEVLWASIMGFLWQGLTLTPFGYGTLSRIDRIANRIKGGES